MRVHVVGNCQSRQFGELLQGIAPTLDIHIYALDEPHLRDESLLAQARDDMAPDDLYFVQTNRVAHLNDVDLKISFGDNVFVVPRIYFNGPFPDMCYVGSFGNRIGVIGDYNSGLVITAYRQGLSAQETKALFNAKTFERLGLFRHWKLSVEEMRDREDGVDFAVSEHISEWVSEKNSLYSHNHPRSNLSMRLLDIFCQKYNIKSYRKNMVLDGLYDPLYVGPWCPIYDFVAEYFSLTYRTGQFFKQDNGDTLSISDFVDRSYQIYGTCDDHDLVVNSPGFTVSTCSKMVLR